MILVISEGRVTDVERDLSLVKDVAAGRVTPDDSPWIFDDDLLYLAVRRLEQAPGGEDLLVALLTGDTDPEGRAHVVACLAGPARARLAST